MARSTVINVIKAKHFTAFMEDLLSYTLGSLGIDWEPKGSLNYTSAKCRRREDFENLPPAVTPDFGDAVLRLRSKLELAFTRQIACFGMDVFESSINLVCFVHSHYKRYFQDPNFQHAFMMFNAFIVDLALNCFRLCKGDLVEVIVMSMNDVYDSHLKHKFKEFSLDDIMA